MSRNGGIGGGGSEHLNDENGMGVSGISFTKALVLLGTGWAVSLFLSLAASPSLPGQS